VTEPHRDPKERHWRALPLWLWMLLMTAAIVALLMYVGRSSFAA
jgi:type VI protein secretion system component VasF